MLLNSIFKTSSSLKLETVSLVDIKTNHLIMSNMALAKEDNEDNSIEAFKYFPFENLK